MKYTYNVTVDDNGDKKWYLNGNLHREDGPAVEWANGNKLWYLNDALHREDGPAVEWSDGAKFWYLNGKLHREDGPAVERSSGTKEWYLNDALHREDGPAIERANGTKEWFLNGEELSESEFNRLTTTVTSHENEMTTRSEMAGEIVNLVIEMAYSSDVFEPRWQDNINNSCNNPDVYTCPCCDAYAYESWSVNHDADCACVKIQNMAKKLFEDEIHSLDC